MRQTTKFCKFVVVVAGIGVSIGLSGGTGASFSSSAFAMAISAKAPAGHSVENDSNAQAWLQKIHDAAQTLNYSGTFVFQQATQIRTSRITHLFDGKTEREKFEILDGKPREYIRSGSEVVSYLPELKVLLIEKRASQELFPAILPQDPAALSRHYLTHVGETGRVAGFESQAVILAPKDNLRYGYKLWAEKNTGLLLRVQTLDERNEVLEQVAFTQLAIGDIDPAKVLPSYRDSTNWRREQATVDPLVVKRWHVNALPSGFKKIREMKRLISQSAQAADKAFGNRQDVDQRAAPREVEQMVYSDGLAAISVFVEPAAKERVGGILQQGALNVMTKRHGDFWLTIVGEVPAVAIKQVADSIELNPR